MGIVVPEEIPHDEENVPLDFTNASNKEIGSIQSRFAVRHSHAIYHAALMESKITFQKRKLRMTEAAFRIIHAGEKKTDVDAMMEENEDIVKLRDALAVHEAQHEVLNAVAEGYSDIRNAASREISRRLGERAQAD